MNKTKTYNKIREICAEHIPEIKEDLSLQDILRVLEHVRLENNNREWQLSIMDEQTQRYFVVTSLDITRSIQDQDEEVLEQLLKIVE